MEYLKVNHPEYLDKIKALHGKKQIEVVGGAFYEAILAILPEEDRIKQLQMTIDWWETNYQITPKGMWLAERVYTPDLPKTLASVNIGYTFIDDYLFNLAGFSEEETYFAYKTEYQGKSITIFPINKEIRYLVPWKEVKETVKYLERGKDPSGEKIIVMISDAEKMGIWPGKDRTTHDICYVSGYDGKKGWIYSFFEEIIQTSWIKPILISDYLKSHSPRGLIYLPTSSYDRMAVWALPTPLRSRLEHLLDETTKKESKLNKDIATFVGGSIWQNFLVKYSQANVMHKRMLYCRKKIKRVEKEFEEVPSSVIAEIWDLLLASQSNDAFWHGLFGGVYYRFLRQMCLRHILFAEKMIDSVYKKRKHSLPVTKIMDVLIDGQPDGILENEIYSCFISSLKGGAIFSLGMKSKGYDFQNVLKRYREAYHPLDLDVIQDEIEKWSFQDHFFTEKYGIEVIKSNKFNDIGNFANEKYIITHGDENALKLVRSDHLIVEGVMKKCSVEKTFQIVKSKLIVEYKIKIPSIKNIGKLFFSPELNFIGSSYPYKTHGVVDDEQFDLKEEFIQEECSFIGIKDNNELEKVAITISFQQPITCGSYPIISHLKSELGFEEQYQGTCFSPFFEIIKPEEIFKIEIVLESL